MARKKSVIDVDAVLSSPSPPMSKDPRFLNLTGQRFSRLFVERYAGKHGARKRSHWVCRCDCGDVAVIETAMLTSGNTTSCGCYHVQRVKETSTVHGHAPAGEATSEFWAWCNMRGRCYDTKDSHYSDYGGRGITVCERWLNGDGNLSAFECFINDLGKKPSPSHTLDRFPDNDGNYEPGNVRWATQEAQQRNRRDNLTVRVNGEEWKVIDLVEEHGADIRQVYKRNSRNLSLRESLIRIGIDVDADQ